MPSRTEANEALARWDDPRSFHILEPLARVGASILPDDRGEFDKEVVKRLAQVLYQRQTGRIEPRDSAIVGVYETDIEAVLLALGDSE